MKRNAKVTIPQRFIETDPETNHRFCGIDGFMYVALRSGLTEMKSKLDMAPTKENSEIAIVSVYMKFVFDDATVEVTTLGCATADDSGGYNITASAETRGQTRAIKRVLNLEVKSRDDEAMTRAPRVTDTSQRTIDASLPPRALSEAHKLAIKSLALRTKQPCPSFDGMTEAQAVSHINRMNAMTIAEEQADAS